MTTSIAPPSWSLSGMSMDHPWVNPVRFLWVHCFLIPVGPCFVFTHVPEGLLTEMSQTPFPHPEGTRDLTDTTCASHVFYIYDLNILNESIKKNLPIHLSIFIYVFSFKWWIIQIHHTMVLQVILYDFPYSSYIIIPFSTL